MEPPPTAISTLRLQHSPVAFYGKALKPWRPLLQDKPQLPDSTNTCNNYQNWLANNLSLKYWAELLQLHTHLRKLFIWLSMCKKKHPSLLVNIWNIPSPPIYKWFCTLPLPVWHSWLTKDYEVTWKCFLMVAAGCDWLWFLLHAGRNSVLATASIQC